MNRALHSSSSRVKAYRALHVLPRRMRVSQSKDSRIWLRSSSGSKAKAPQRDLRFSETGQEYAFPAGLTPSGCVGSAVAPASISSVNGFATDVSLTFFVGGSSTSPGAILPMERSESSMVLVNR
jgi:hypothetical protein